MWPAIMTGASFGLVGIVLSIVGYKLFDLVETKVDFAQELKNGNMAVAVVIVAFLLGICFIIGRAVGS